MSFVRCEDCTYQHDCDFHKPGRSWAYEMYDGCVCGKPKEKVKPMPWTRCEDCIYQPTCDWPDQLYGSCELGTPKPEEVELLKREKENVMDVIDKILCKLIVPNVGDHGQDLVNLGHHMVNGSGDEMDKFGIELMQITNHIADWSNKLVAISDPELAKELNPKFDKLKAKWEEEYPGVPFLR